MNVIQAGRLLTLAYFLKTQVPKDRFNMEVWAEITKPEQCDAQMRRGIKSPDDWCGTSACALGWATAIWPDVFELDFSSCGEASVLYKGTNRWEFFGLTDWENANIFIGSPCTPKQKARQIERLVSKHGYEYAN